MPATYMNEDSAEWGAEFQQVVDEASRLVKTYYEMDEDWHVMDHLNERNSPTTCAIKLTCTFVDRKIHKYQDARKRVFLAEWFGFDRATSTYHVKSGNKLIDGDKNAISEPSIGFLELWPLMEGIGIKLNVEGWLRRRDLQVRFIDRHIEMLQQRRKQIEEKQIETHV